MPPKSILNGSAANRRAALIRVSTDEQAEDGYSPEVQLARIQAFALAQFGETVADADIFSEMGVSGRTGALSKRPGLAQILDACEHGLYSHVIVHKLDRLGRNVGLMSKALETMEKHGTTFVTVQDQIDGTSPAGKLFISIFCAVAQWYSDNLSEEVKKGHEGRRKAGHINGFAPYGAIKDSAIGLPVADLRPLTLSDGTHSTPYAGFLAAMEMSAAGKSPRAVTAWLITQGYTALHGGRQFTANVVRGMRENRFYLGEIKDGKEGWVPGAHAPLIDLALWERVQRAITHNRQRPSTIPLKSHANPLGGSLLRCATCYAQGVSAAFHAHNKKTGRVYVCSRHHSRGTCTEPSSIARRLESQVGWLFQQFALSTENQELLITLYHAKAQASAAEQPDYVAQRRTAQGRLDRLRKLFEWDDIDDAAYHVQRRALREELAQIEVMAQQTPSVEKMLDLRGYLQNAAAAWEDAEDEERRDLAHLFFQALWVKDQQIVGVEPTETYQELFQLMHDSRSLVYRTTQVVPLPLSVIPIHVPPYSRPHSTGFRLSPTIRSTIVERRRQGVPYRVIQADLHVSLMTISKVMKADATLRTGVQE